MFPQSAKRFGERGSLVFFFSKNVCVCVRRQGAIKESRNQNRLLKNYFGSVSACLSVCLSVSSFSLCVFISLSHGRTLTPKNNVFQLIFSVLETILDKIHEAGLSLSVSLSVSLLFSLALSLSHSRPVFVCAPLCHSHSHTVSFSRK